MFLHYLILCYIFATLSADKEALQVGDLKNGDNKNIEKDSEKSKQEDGLKKYAGVFGGGLDYYGDLSPFNEPMMEHIRVKRFSNEK